MDELERRLRAEKERQQRIKQQLTDTRGKPPPNFRLMSSQARQQSSSYEEQAPEPQYQEEPQYEPEPEQSYQQRSPSPRRGQVSGRLQGWGNAGDVTKERALKRDDDRGPGLHSPLFPLPHAPNPNLNNSLTTTVLTKVFGRPCGSKG